MGRIDLNEIISAYNLSPLDHEGGYFRRIVESEQHVQTPPLGPFSSERLPVVSAIYYLMSRDSFSALHSLLSHEIWTFICGDPIEQLTIDPQYHIQTKVLGEEPLYHGVTHIPPKYWQASRVVKGGEYGFALCSTVVTPGYDQRDFTLADASLLHHLDIKDIPLVREFLSHEGEL